MRILEDKRSEFISKGKAGAKEKTDNKSRFEKRLKSRVANNVRNYNKLDMNKLFKQGILDVDVDVHGETGDYVVGVSFGGFIDNLREQLRDDTVLPDLKDVIKALVKTFNGDNVYLRCTCLHPDTRIRLTDGTTPTVRELLDRFNRGELLYTLSLDENDIISNKIIKVWQTGTVEEFIRVTLDNGAFIDTTSNHLYLLSDNTYRIASYLKPGDVLASIEFKSKANQRRTDRVITSVESLTVEATPIYDVKVENTPNFLAGAGVILHNCDDFKYRHAYWMSKHDLILGDREDRPSDITNPSNNLGPGCKHIMLVLSNHNWLLKVASTITNYIKYMENHYNKMYADIIYPALYNKKYEKPVQLNVFDKDNLTDKQSSKQDIDASNIEASRRGQFKPGNPYRFNPRPNSSQDSFLDDEV